MSSISYLSNKNKVLITWPFKKYNNLESYRKNIKKLSKIKDNRKITSNKNIINCKGNTMN